MDIHFVRVSEIAITSNFKESREGLSLTLDILEAQASRERERARETERNSDLRYVCL